MSEPTMEPTAEPTVEPTVPPDRFAGLTAAERFNVRAIEWWHSVRPLRWLSAVSGHYISRNAIKVVCGNLVRTHHFEQVRDLPLERGVLLCASHRSFLDNFAVSSFAWDHVPASMRFVVPSRTEGVYDHWFGILVNIVLGCGNIYPPIVRGSRGTLWGKQVIEILIGVLNGGPTVVPIHPEGGRNKGPDPYSLMRGRPGLGKIIHQTRASVLPVFLHGFPVGPWAVLRANYRPGARKRPHVHAVMGPPVDFSAERAQPGSPALYYEISQKLVAAIAALMDEEKALRAATPAPK